MKKFKLFKIFSIFAIAAAGAVAVGVGSKAPKVESAEASGVPSTVYIDISAINGEACYWAHMWGKGSDTDRLFQLVPGMSSLYKVSVDSGDKSLIVVRKDKQYNKTFDWNNVWNQTADLTIPTDGKNVFVISSDCVNGYWDTCSEIPDGAYLRGKYHGVTNWSSNITLSDDIIDESIVFDSDENKISAMLELYEGDSFKFVRYFNGRQLEMKIAFSVESVDNVYYPVGWDGNNPKVLKGGVYKITMGYGSGDTANQTWYHFNNTASIWSGIFLGSMTCNNGGNSDLTWNVKEGSTLWKWSDFQSSYAALDSYAKDRLYGADAKDSGTSIEMAAKRHDACVAHYKWSAFMTDGENSQTRSSAIGYRSIFNAESTDMTLAIVIISIVSVSAIAGFYFIRKRKHI